MGDDIYLQRTLSDILPGSNVRRLVVLTGARQTGKTTLAKKAYPQLRYINLDAPENREILRRLATPLWGGSIGNAILDEAQKEPSVFEKVKYAYDEKTITFSLLLGSSQILLLKKIRESLAGRVSIFELWPLMLSELAAWKNAPAARPPLIDRLLKGDPFGRVLEEAPSVQIDAESARLRAAEDHLLVWGGMPALLTLSDEERRNWLKDYEYTYLERDLSDLARLADLQPFTTFQRLSALRTGKILNYSELARDAGISAETGRRYLEYLRLSYQVILLAPYRTNLTSSVVKSPKLYWVDVGLARRLAGMGDGVTGELYETMVVSELFKWNSTMKRDAGLFFYRTRSGMELDLLLRTPAGLIGMEIKARDRISRSDTRSMRDVAAALGREWRGGLLVYRGEEIVKLGEPEIWAVPSRRLFA